MIHFVEIDMDKINEEEFNDFPQKSLFTTKEWINFVAMDSGATPLIVEIWDDKIKIGYFTGLSFSKFGIKMIGSPFSGWSTCFMGVDIKEGYNRLDIVQMLIPYLFKTYKCMYIEFIDRNISFEQVKKEKINYEVVNTLELEIDKSDEGLFKVFKTDCRNFIRQFERRGATLEVAEPNDEFAEEYYKQLEDVFAKQNLVPTYSVEKVKRLLYSLKNTDKILCLRVRNPEHESIATSIFVGHNKKFFFWGGASYRSQQSYRPNEYMIWTAIKYWRDRGVSVFDMVGVRDYKKKFGSTEKEYPRLIFTRYKVLYKLRNIARDLYYFKGKVFGFLEHKK